jgi:hypothetical protein
VRAIILAAAAIAATAGPALAAEAWTPIFNGRDLTGWTPKIAGHPLGDNWRDTFQAKDGVLRVSYANYDRFAGEFGHLIYQTPLSSYRLRFAYRFVGPVTPGAPAWAVRNSGVMLHGQSPESMALEQSFPVSVEAQLLGVGSGAGSTTGNVCTPGVSVVMDGAPVQEHCRASGQPAFPDGEWVRFEVEVHGGRSIRQFVNGRPVIEYGDVRIATGEYPTFRLTAPQYRDGEPLNRGWISLQAEGHPLEFRDIELLRLPE